MTTITLIRRPAVRGAIVRDGQGDVFSFDATLSEQATDSADLTDHPVETGVDLTDHLKLNPTELQLTGIISGAPFPRQGLPSIDREREAYQQLLELHRRGETVTIVTGLRVYRNMLLTTVTVGRSEGGEQAIRPQCTFREVQFGTAATINIPDGKRRRSGKPSSGKGSQGNEQVKDKTKPENDPDAGASAEAKKAESGEPQGSHLHTRFGGLI